MATASIMEFTNLPTDGNGRLVPVLPNADHCTQQSRLTFAGTTQSAAVQDTTKFVDLRVSVDSYYEIGENPTATVNSSQISAGSPVQREITPGHKIAFYDGTS